jgi:lipopolysaccharide transport system permease protein
MSQNFDIVIEPNKTEVTYWKDIWRYKDLFYILAWRDIKVRYKQTVLGIAWSVIRPLLTMIIFTIVFSKIAELPSEGDAPYPILVYVAMLPWQFFANALSETSNSLIANSNLISKVYFPRIIIPTSTIVTSLVDFGISFGLLFVIMACYQYLPSWQIIFLPLFLILACITALSFGLYLSAVNVKYRDFRYIIPFITQFGLYISPVGFSSSTVPEEWKILYALNPMVGIIDGFRWCIIGNMPFPAMAVGFSILVSSIVLFIGIKYFRKVEKSFADVI